MPFGILVQGPPLSLKIPPQGREVEKSKPDRELFHMQNRTGVVCLFLVGLIIFGTGKFIIWVMCSRGQVWQRVAQKVNSVSKE